MARIGWRVLLGVTLVGTSACIYIIQIAVFHRSEDTFFYMLQDLAFVPVQVLLVTLVISEVLKERERSAIKHKMNMVIGSFFSEAGSTMLHYFVQFDTHEEEIREITRVDTSWTDHDFARAGRRLERHEYTIDCRCADMNELKQILTDNNQLMLNLLANPNLLEHESFTDLLWAISHLTSELHFRRDLDHLPDTDYAHLANDMRRAYVLMIQQWLYYVRHLRDHYPHMFSLVVRANPFEPSASVEVRE
jgi:hypothetical protein